MRYRRKLVSVLEIITNNLILIAIALYFIAPMIWLWTSAFRINPSFRVEFSDWSLENFITIFFHKKTATWIRNSIIIALSTSVLVTCLASLAAYPMARLEFKGKMLLHTLMILSMTIPLSSVLVPTYSLIRTLKLENTLLGVILVCTGRAMPMAIWIMREFIRTIPREIEEAAWIDGCGRIMTLIRIVLPLAAPGLAVVALTSFVGAWGEFLVPLIVISSDELKPISLGLYDACLEHTRAWGYVTIDYGLLAAISIVYVIVPTIVYAILGKYLIRGMVIGALKR